MVAPLIARGAAALAARAAAKNAAKKSAQKAAKSEANPEDKLLDSALVGLSGAKAAGAAGMAMGQERRRDEAMKRDKAAKDRESGEPKKYARGGGIYSAEMGQPPVDIDGGSAPTPRPKNVSKRRPNAAETSKPQGKKDQTARYARGGGIELRGKTKCKIV